MATTAPMGMQIPLQTMRQLKAAQETIIYMEMSHSGKQMRQVQAALMALGIDVGDEIAEEIGTGTNVSVVGVSDDRATGDPIFPEWSLEEIGAGPPRFFII